ncbi:MAG TPA: ferritin family protein [Anaeromyxobacteraceae bacterium]|nr:ferritin family protein [Anaeromyxobacteraceae bacterium]
MRTRTDLASRCAAAAVAALWAAAASAVEPAATTANLQAAFENDVRARDRYRAFAERAERDGEPDAAALFRAAAHAEGVRARLHGDTLRRLGAEPRPATAAVPTAGDTRANLLAILGRENIERATVYPSYVERARRDAIPEAVLAFTLAHHAEASLVALYQDAVAGRRPPREHGDFHVCETCGYVVRGDPPERCPVSLSPRGAFTRIP